MVRRRVLGIYIAVMLTLASAAAIKAYTAPLECTDGYGHGPDPGTRECLHAIAVQRDRRVQDTSTIFLGIVLLGSAGLALLGGAAHLRRLSGRDSHAYDLHGRG